MQIPSDIKDGFLYPIGNYYGEFTSQNLAFNGNLQIFATGNISLQLRTQRQNQARRYLRKIQKFLAAA